MKQVTSMAAILGLFFLCAACDGGAENSATVTPNGNTAATASIPTLASTPTSAVVAVQSTSIVTQPVTESQPISPTNEQPNSPTDRAVPIDSGLPVAIASLLPNANPIHGSELALQNGCSACHSLDEGIKIVGPSWYNLANHAATRVAGESAPLYLYHSIISPNQYVLEGFLPNLMPQTYADQLSEQDMADLLAYLLTLQAK